MSSCCSDKDACDISAVSEKCPRCGARGKEVDPITLKALLNAEGLLRGVPPAPRFCATPACPVVYFDNSVPISFNEDLLTVPVYAKHPENPHVPVCYCFGYTPAKIQNEVERSGFSSASKTITAEVKAGHCACEVKNPKGVCCLGDVSRVERQVALTGTNAIAQEV